MPTPRHVPPAGSGPRLAGWLAQGCRGHIAKPPALFLTAAKSGACGLSRRTSGLPPLRAGARQSARVFCEGRRRLVTGEVKGAGVHGAGACTPAGAHAGVWLGGSRALRNRCPATGLWQRQPAHAATRPHMHVHPPSVSSTDCRSPAALELCVNSTPTARGSPPAWLNSTFVVLAPVTTCGHRQGWGFDAAGASHSSSALHGGCLPCHPTLSSHDTGGEQEGKVTAWGVEGPIASQEIGRPARLTVKLGRSMIGCKYMRFMSARSPFFCVTWNSPYPSCVVGGALSRASGAGCSGRLGVGGSMLGPPEPLPPTPTPMSQQHPPACIPNPLNTHTHSRTHARAHAHLPAACPSC